MVTTWTLVVFIYAGAFAKGDSVTIDHISGFQTEQQCIEASAKMKPFVQGTAKEIETICIAGGN